MDDKATHEVEEGQVVLIFGQNLFIGLHDLPESEVQRITIKEYGADWKQKPTLQILIGKNFNIGGVILSGINFRDDCLMAKVITKGVINKDDALTTGF